MAKLENKTKENPKLEQNKLSDGRISLYLEYYLGREEKPVLDENGNQVYYESGKMQGKPKFAIKHHRRKENLSLYLIEKPRTPAERQQNKETLELAVKIRAEREQEFKESMLGYRLKKDRNVNFLDYFQAYINDYTKKDIRHSDGANRPKPFQGLFEGALPDARVRHQAGTYHERHDGTVRSLSAIPERGRRG